MDIKICIILYILKDQKSMLPARLIYCNFFNTFEFDPDAFDWRNQRLEY